MVDSSLKFHSHVNWTITKANCTLGLINRTFQYREPEMIIKLYKSLVRPQLECGNAIWGPYYTIDQKSIESIQRRATKMIPHIIGSILINRDPQFLKLYYHCDIGGWEVTWFCCTKLLTCSNTDDSRLDLLLLMLYSKYWGSEGNPCQQPKIIYDSLSTIDKFMLIWICCDDKISCLISLVAVRTSTWIVKCARIELIKISFKMFP